MSVRPFSVNEIYELFNSNYDDEMVFNLEADSWYQLMNQTQAGRNFFDEDEGENNKIVIPCNGLLTHDFQERGLTLNVLFKIDVIIELSLDENTDEFKGISEFKHDVNICSYHLSEVIPFASDINNNKLIQERLIMDDHFTIFNDPYNATHTNDLGLFIKHECKKFTTNLKHFFGISDIFSSIYKQDKQIRDLYY